MSLRHQRGTTLIEALIAASVAVLAALAATVYVTRSALYVQHSEDQAFARQKAVSILGELKAFVESGQGEIAADLDGFDDGTTYEPSLTITEDPAHPGSFLPPDHAVSGNVEEGGNWRWYRRIAIDPMDGLAARDIRMCTVSIFRAGLGRGPPGEQIAKVSGVIRTVGDAYPTTQVYDLYLLALENVPGWWADLDAILPIVEATLTDLESRNRGLRVRTHWITKLGYGRDLEYAPFTNEERTTTDATPWTYVYPGRLPSGEAATRYYAAGRMRARMNIDGVPTPAFANDHAHPETYTDSNGNARWDEGEAFVDADGDGRWDAGNPVPYALADGHNHCLRWPEAEARFAARVDAGLEDENAPTWRLLLDRMVREPDRYHNALVVNLHGELLPLPPVRNVSDAAKDPVGHPGWRAVTHPERLRPRRVAGNDVLSEAPRFRVYAYQTRFPDPALLVPQQEPLKDLNGNGAHDGGEVIQDWNGNGVWDEGLPISIVIRDGDFAAAPNDAAYPSIRVQRLSGGIDANGDGSGDDYVDWNDAPRYPEAFVDTNTDGVRQRAEPWLDLDGDGAKGATEPHQELDGDGTFSPATESLTDVNGNGVWDDARPAETFADANGNGEWDAPEPYWDVDGNGTWTPPTTPQTPWVPWDPVSFGIPSATELYVQRYGEPFLDVDGNASLSVGEAFFDANGNGVRDGGYARGEMYFEITYDATADQTVLHLYGTPLSTPYLSNAQNDQKGLPAIARLYDYDYVPCPTPSSPSDSDRFADDLYASGSGQPKNTARWTIELPLAAIRTAFQSAPGYGDGDHLDRLVTLETRLGDDLTTGTVWPVHHAPPNLSVTHAYFYADVADVPFSERHQFLGDPRHSPYADTDAAGTTAPHGYNWYFDDFKCGEGSDDWRDEWPAFHADRLRNGWNERGGGHDVPRLLAWLRTALCRSEAVYATLDGQSFSFLSLGGDVGSDAAHGFPSGVPVNGTPFGLTGTVYENTFLDSVGTSGIRGSLKYVRENDGSSSSGLRNGGSWWSKPWLGELYPDVVYTTQWAAHGNLAAASGGTAGEFHLIKRGDVPTDQLPGGTRLDDRALALGYEGCTSFFNTGSSAAATFHHQTAGGGLGDLTAAGNVLANGFGFRLVDTATISRPFGLATSGSGTAGDEFSFTDVYPRSLASEVLCFYDHANGQSGSGVIQLCRPSDPGRAARVLVSGLDPHTGAGSAASARRALVAVLHTYLEAGWRQTAPRIRQLPRLQILSPTEVDELDDPDYVTLAWRTSWERWDGRPYTPDYADTFVEDEAQLVYVPMYSTNDGASWNSVLDDEPVEPGVLPWVEGAGPSPSCTVADWTCGGDESLMWALSRTIFVEGSYLVRIDAYRLDERLHYAHHVEKIHVRR